MSAASEALPERRLNGTQTFSASNGGDWALICRDTPETTMRTAAASPGCPCTLTPVAESWRPRPFAAAEGVWEQDPSQGQGRAIGFSVGGSNPEALKCLCYMAADPPANLTAVLSRCKPTNMSAHTQSPGWPVAPTTRSAPLRIIQLIFSQPLAAGLKFNSEAHYRSYRV
ncbi:unnamed protein product [Pleuronectes platessa]|uniref:Uncharacterized protein n=1 Tax=Pleuronectes platessa TaxID=8262 RepID=A0A9N7TZ02_PLEPL|nr:unnamed protein product [Pleuronectes platessa]